MRPLEVAVVVLLLIQLCFSFVSVSRRSTQARFLPLVTAVIACIQVSVEHFRWQMLPAYALAIVMLGLGIPSMRVHPIMGSSSIGRARRFARGIGVVFGFLIWIVAFVLPYALPVFELPKPTGSMGVGTTMFEWVDASRAEELTAEPNDRRDLSIQVWYPAQIGKESEPQGYWHDAGALDSAIAKENQLPNGLFNYLELVKTHSHLDAPLLGTPNKFPIVVFSHGIWGIANQNTIQAEELASRGYVVFSVSHPYEALATQYPDGRVLAWNNAHRKSFGEAGRATFKAYLKQYTQSKDPVLREALIRQALKDQKMAVAAVNRWTSDVRFVLDQLEHLERGDVPSVFAGRLDIERIGIFGHSFGGTTAGQVCLMDKRCKAGLNMDGLQWGDTIDQPLEQPFMVMNSDDPARAEVETSINDFIYGRGHNPHYRLLIKGSKHGNYTDYADASPLFRMLGVFGSIDAGRMANITNRYLLAFFDKHLKGIESPLLQAPVSEFPEADFRARNL